MQDKENPILEKNVFEESFSEVVELIRSARKRALQAVNTELIDLYWRIGEHLHRKIENDGWGKGTIVRLAAFIAQREPALRGFSPQNLWRMRNFFQAYESDQKLSPLVRVLPWTHNTIILAQSKSAEEREFYLRMAIQEGWSKRELERQFRMAAFERTILHPPQISSALRELHGGSAENLFKDSYVVEFLNLPEAYDESDLQKSLIGSLKNFLFELGRDFCFIGSEYPVQVGNRDFALDLLFFHRGLNCLVAFELKVGRFEPEHLGKLSFYLEALDKDHRKPHENPSIGVLLCATKDSEVVEYALSRTLSPALIAEYQTQMPDKKILAAKLHEFYALNASIQETSSEEGEARGPSGKARGPAPTMRL